MAKKIVDALWRPRMSDIDLELEDDLYEKLIELAEDEGVAIETLVEQILMDYCFGEDS